MGRDVNPFHIEIFTNLRQYQNAQKQDQLLLSESLDTRMEEVTALAEKMKKQKRHYTEYSNEQKLLFVYYIIE